MSVTAGSTDSTASSSSQETGKQKQTEKKSKVAEGELPARDYRA